MITSYSLNFRSGLISHYFTAAIPVVHVFYRLVINEYHIFCGINCDEQGTRLI